jgi:signal transduction histidine kinase
MNIISYNEYLLNLCQISSKNRAEETLEKLLRKNPQLMEIYRRARNPMTHSVRKQLTLHLLNGKTVNVQVHALSLREGGKVNGVILYMKNLGMLKELEQNLHRSMRYTIISQLASGVGHEIRNPLSSLAIHTEVLEGLTQSLPVDGESKQKMKKSIKILHTEIERITRLLDQFFNLAKPKEVELNFEDINDVVKEVLELVNQQAMERQVNLHVRLGRNLPMVNISHDQIKQVLLNIILNAFDAMPRGGDIYIRTFEHEDKVVVVIRDTGQGIPENIRSKIFDLYFSTKPGGGGVGLAISRKIVEAHEGRLYFKTEVGKGTRFFVELPRT